jgi:hypothetical protein
MSGFGYFKVTPMSVVARFFLGWTAISVVVAPFVGMLLHRQQLDTVPVSAVPVPVPVAVPVPVPVAAQVS